MYPSVPVEGDINNERQRLLPPATHEYGTITTTTSYQTLYPPITTNTTNFVVTQPFAARYNVAYGPAPVDMQCPICHIFMRTHLLLKLPSRRVAIACVVSLLQLYCCVCIPDCVDGRMNTEHYCGTCNSFLGTHVCSSI